jgi:hypothetical protein
MWETKVAPLSGALFGILLVASYVVDANTDFMPPEDEVVAYLADGPVAIMASAYLRLLAAAALVWFGGSLHRWLRGSDDDKGRLSILAMAGATLASALIAVGAMATVAASERMWTTGSIDPGTAAALFDVAGIAIGNGAPLGLAVMIGASGITALRSGLLPGWAGWGSVALGAALLSPYAWIVVALVIVWVPAAGLRIYRQAAHHPEGMALG